MPRPLLHLRGYYGSINLTLLEIFSVLYLYLSSILTKIKQPNRNPFPSHPLMSCSFRATYIVVTAVFVPLLYAMEPFPLTVRFHASLQSDSAFSAMSRGSAPSLIPLIGGCPPGSPAAGEFRSHSHFPVSLFIHKSGARYRPELTAEAHRTAQPAAEQQQRVNSSAHGQPMR